MSLFLALLAAAGPSELTRPVPPSFPVIAATTCDDPAQRSNAIAEADKGMNSGLAGEYNTAWQTYLDARMERIGMSQEERSKFAVDVLGSNEFKAIQGENEGLLKQMMADLDKITRTKDEVLSCKALAHMTALIPQMQANAERQFMLMDKRLDAEAARRGK